MMYYLAGLPRSGSTLLGTLLSQHPSIEVTATSSLIDLIGTVIMARNNNPSEKSQDPDEKLIHGMIRGMIEGRYSENYSDKIIIDKSRGWTNPGVMTTMNAAMKRPMKIIATVRNVDECLASFVELKKVPSDKVRDFILNDQMPAHLRESFKTLKAGLDAFPEQIHLVEYDELIKNPQSVMDGIYDFIGIDIHSGVFDNLVNVVPEADAEVWGVPDLHTLKPSIEKTKRNLDDVLGRSRAEYHNLEFWRPDWIPTDKSSDEANLDFQLSLSLHGQFKESRMLINSLAKENPECNRIAFNKGWFKMRDGDLREAGRFIDRGRLENVFGNQSPPSNAPIVTDDTDLAGKVVLLHGEGGLGDEIINMRFAQRVVARGGSVVLVCSPSLASVFSRSKFISACVSHEAVKAGIYHDYRIPAMSAPWILNNTMDDLDDGIPYLRATSYKHLIADKNKIGLCYKGNAAFEHEQHRVFPRELLNEAVAGHDTVSLQYGENKDIVSWEDTINEIVKCKLVISSCTSVAHMSAALGIPTWIIVPILPYYLWAPEGNKTAWYKNVTLFRQEQYGNWKEPFDKIRKALSVDVVKV